MKVRKLGAILLAGSLMVAPVVTSTAMAESSATESTDSTQSIVDESGNLIIEGTTVTGVTDKGKEATEIVIPNGVTSISGGAFLDCTNLKSVSIPNSVITIESAAFENCSNLKSITIPDSVTKVGSNAFYGCENLENAIIGNGVVSLGMADPSANPDVIVSLFGECRNLKTVTIGDNVKDFAWGNAFSWCPSLESINVSEKNKYFSSSNGILFDKDKTKLMVYPANKTETSYTIPKTVTEIDYVYGKNLKSVYIHKNVTDIAVLFAFTNCTNLKDVYYEGAEEQLLEIIAASDLNQIFDDEVVIHYNSTMPEETPDTPSSSSSSSSSTTTPESSSSSSSSSSTTTPESSSSSSSSSSSTTPESSSSTTTESKDFSDSTTKVTVSVPKTLFEGTLNGAELSVEQVKNTDVNDKTVTYDITFKDKDGKVVSLDKNTTEITVKLPIPEALKGEKKLYVYYVDNGKYTDMKATVKDGSLEFKTTHFSKYLITTDGTLESTDKENADTGFGGIAMTIGIVALAGAAIVVAKKNH